MSTKRTDIKLTSVDDLFKTQETREVKNDAEMRELAPNKTEW